MSDVPSVQPTRTRHRLIGFAVALAVIQYVDRICISQAAPLISADLGLSKAQMGWVFSAFILAYALFEVPTGWWGDRTGPRGVLLRVVLWWSAFTAATGLAWNWGSLVAMRFLFGAGEAGCFPNLAKAFSRWLPATERARAQGILWMCARWGGAVTPALVLLFLSFVNWRVTFLLFGLMGVAWAWFFARWFSDDPRRHPQINAAEAALLPESAPSAEHGAVPWGRIARSRAVWLLCGQYFSCSYAFYFLVTWFPTYLMEAHGFDLKGSALLAGLPLLLGGFGSMLGGMLAARAQRRGATSMAARRRIGMFGLSLAALCLVVAAITSRPLLAVAVISLAAFGNDLALPGAWTACMEVGGRFTGTVSGLMNMVGNVGGFLSPIVLGYLVGRTGAWSAGFYLTALLYATGVACWWALASARPLEEGPAL